MSLKPYYQTDLGVLYHGDCMDILPGLDPVDLVLTDPPYGQNRQHRGVKKFGEIYGNNKPFDPSPIFIGSKHILWGANFFASRLSDESRWLFWIKYPDCVFDKRIGSPIECAWTDIGGSSKAFRWIWDGYIKQGLPYGKERIHCHPYQKPVELMSWCLQMADGICLDPFIGSGTTAVACERLNRKWIGIEISERYCEIAANRIEKERAQLKLFPQFEQEQPKMEQASII